MRTTWFFANSALGFHGTNHGLLTCSSKPPRAPPRRMSALTANGSAVVDGDGAIVARLPSSSSLSPLSTFLNGI